MTHDTRHTTTSRRLASGQSLTPSTPFPCLLAHPAVLHTQKALQAQHRDARSPRGSATSRADQCCSRFLSYQIWYIYPISRLIHGASDTGRASYRCIPKLDSGVGVLITRKPDSANAEFPSTHPVTLGMCISIDGCG